MKISPVNINYYSGLKTHAQADYGHAQLPSFKGRDKATADDSKISWGIIAGVAVAAFAVAAVTAIGVRNSINRLKVYAKEFEGKFGDLGKRFNSTAKAAGETAKRSLPQKGVMLEVDSQKLRQLPEHLKKQAKNALNSAVTPEQYQKVLREFRIWK